MVAALLAGLMAASPAPVRSLRETLFDGYQRVFPRERRSAPVTIVAIDERSLAELGQWPWPRSQIARLVERIASDRPAAVGFDVLFPEADRLSADNDKSLAAALARSPSVLAVAGLAAPDARYLAPPAAKPVRMRPGGEPRFAEFAGHLGNVPVLEASSVGRGLIDTNANDRVVRRVPLFARVQGVLVPTLSLELWRVASGAPSFTLDAPHAGVVDVRFADAALPMQADDATAWLRYSRHEPERFLSAVDVLRGRYDAQRIRSKIVLIGVTGIGLLDFKLSPLGELVPGVELHAQLMEQIFDGTHLVRPAWALWLELALFTLGSALLVVLVPAVRVRHSVAVLAAFLVAVAVLGLSAFRAGGVLVDIAWPAIGLVTGFALLLAAALSEADRQRRQLREAAARAAGELEAARRIQMGLLPDPRPLLADEPRILLDALVRPARTVGGDFYECFKLDDERLFFAVADVSGKGMPAALFMALCKATLKAAAMGANGAPDVALRHAARELGRDNPEALFVTVFAATLHIPSGRLDYCNAGHEPPFVRVPGAAVKRLPSAGRPPLGVGDEFEFRVQTRWLANGEWICAITDGVTEAMNPEGGLFGASRLERLLEGLPDEVHPAALCDAVSEAVHAFSAGAQASDDLTLLALRWTSGR